MSQHTPGRQYSCDDNAFIGAGKLCPLHAAAPEMFSLLNMIVEDPCDHGPQTFCPRKAARALLAKVEGK